MDLFAVSLKAYTTRDIMKKNKKGNNAMSTPMKVSCKCFVCNHESNQTVLASTNRFGSPDLDLRPPEMERSTMHWWIQECPYCGYVAPRIKDKTTVDKSFLESEEYIGCSNYEFKSSLAKQFYKQYLINAADKNHRSAFHSALRAAWCCDDAIDCELAIVCRKLALSEIDHFIDENKKEKDTLLVMKSDLLRRSEMFDEVIESYNPLDFKEELLQKIIEFQIKKSKEKDASCYRVDQTL